MFIVVIIFYYLFLLYYSINYISFSIVDIDSINKFYPLKYILEVSFSIFGKNDFALHFPQIIVSFFSVILFFNLTKFYFKSLKDRQIITLLFISMPGIIISTLIINKSIYLIFLVLIFVYFYKKYYYLSLFILASYIFIDYSFISLYFSLIFYSVYKKDRLLLVLSLLFLSINANYFSYHIGGKPRGFLIDLLVTYSLIFSPLLFIYFLFYLYKGVIFFKKDILFFIVFFTFIESIILSFRQKITIDDYAPFIVIYIILMYKFYLSSLRVRLPIFRKNYRRMGFFVISTIILFDIFMFFYAPIYKESNVYFFSKKLAYLLKDKKVDCNDKRLCKVLNFYHVKPGKEVFVKYLRSKNRLEIFDNNRIIILDVSKINTSK